MTTEKCSCRSNLCEMEGYCLPSESWFCENCLEWKPKTETPIAWIVDHLICQNCVNIFNAFGLIEIQMRLGVNKDLEAIELRIKDNSVIYLSLDSAVLFGLKLAGSIMELRHFINQREQ